MNVALALISQPMVVFLDEPTSGLDSKMANEVCSILTLRLTSSGMWLGSRIGELLRRWS